MDIKAVHGADTSCGKHGGELLHLARRGAHEHHIRLYAVQTVVMVKHSRQLHVGRSLHGLFGSTAYIPVP